MGRITGSGWGQRTLPGGQGGDVFISCCLVKEMVMISQAVARVMKWRRDHKLLFEEQNEEDFKGVSLDISRMIGSHFIPRECQLDCLHAPLRWKQNGNSQFQWLLLRKSRVDCCTSSCRRSRLRMDSQTIPRETEYCFDSQAVASCP
ncbi:hypothetical protein chiPu_0019511 [Chiloscyllium punctatum]|uniref:Uncharacterized protein n=1 Tax=Chiloscyllium punctatum TaxID=137246 RepID=A0A401RSA8_CHIPU|nr:hypothetical protein [Chiloscyllium punctatum]